MRKKYHRLIVILLLFTGGLVSVSAQNQKNDRVIPRRGFPDLIPYLKSENELISMHIATIQDAQQEIAKMPRVIKVKEEWPNVSEGDDLFDITAWFPLNEMRLEKDNSEDDKRWVYYNQTNGYIIANADHFLHSSIYNFVKEKLFKHGFVNRLSVHWLEVDADVELDRESIEKAGYKTLMKFSHSAKEYENLKSSDHSQQYSNTVYPGRNNTDHVSLYMREEGTVETQTELHLKSNVERFYDYGISSPGKRSLMLVNSSRVNLLGDLLYFPINERIFNRFHILHEYKDNMKGHSDMEYYTSYSVTADTVTLLGGNQEHPDYNGDPFGDHQLPEKYQGDTIDISDLFLNQGVVQIKAILDRPSNTLFVYGNALTHDQVGEIFDGVLWGAKLLGYRSQIDLYEVSKDSNGLKEISLNNVDKTAKHLANVDSLSQQGARCYIFQNSSVCKVECVRGNKADSLDVSIDFDLKLPDIEFKSVLIFNALLDEEKVMKVGTIKGDKEIWMKFKVSKSVDHEK